MNKNQYGDSKITELQGIRGIAIIAVVGFHFYPRHFPNGYLGVDQFFVLSGFLMCMLLKRTEGESPCTLASLFYAKRFKRILPLYLLVILLSMISLYTYFPDTAVETNKESATKAILFMSNRHKSAQENYFEMLNMAQDIFAHTWSLSVEMQFYLLVPFLFILVRSFSLKFQLTYYSTLALLSFSFHILSSPQASFNSVFSRVWQFLLGMIIFSISTKSFNPSAEVNESSVRLLSLESSPEIESAVLPATRSSNYFSYILLFLPLIIISFPQVFNPVIVRPILTLATSAQLLCSGNNKILTNGIFLFLGDISYSLYLVHWPMYAHWKLTSSGNQFYLAGYLLTSILLSVLLYQFFEKWYRNLSFQSVGTLVLSLYICLALLINENEILDHFDAQNRIMTSSDEIPVNSTMDDAASFNHRWNVDDYRNLFVSTCEYEGVGTAFGWCRHKGLSKLSKYKMAIIGNSWTANHASLFYQECGHKAKSILQGSASACEPLFPTLGKPNCKENFTDFEVRIHTEQPDYVFILTRFVTIGDPFPENVKSFDKDPIYQTMSRQMLKLIANVKRKLFILDYVPRLNTGVIENIVPMLKQNTDPSVVDRVLVSFENYDMARKRHARLVEDCGEKCVLVDYAREFWNNATGTYRYFDDRGFSYFTSTTHLSPHGLEHIRHVWKDVCRTL